MDGNDRRKETQEREEKKHSQPNRIREVGSW